MRVILFFTYGVSLKNWGESGLLYREIRLYEELILKHGIEVQFITYGDSRDRQWESHMKGIQLLPIYERLRRPDSKILSLLQSFYVPWIFRHELRQADIFKTNQIWGGWVATISKWLFHKPLLVRCGYEFYDFSRKQERSRLFQSFAYWISWLIYKNANLINVASTLDQNFVEKEFKIERSLIELCPNWVDTDIFKTISLEKRNQILFVGRLNLQKNINLLLESINSTDITLNIVGEGELNDQINKWVLKKNIKVNFLGRIPNNKMPEIYNKYKIYVICSSYEGNPKTLLEAMACGCAVIGTKVPGIKEIIRHEITGILVSEDPREIRSAINRLLSDQLLCKKLGLEAQKQILNNNSLKNALIKESSTYRRIVKYQK